MTGVMTEEAVVTEEVVEMETEVGGGNRLSRIR